MPGKSPRPGITAPGTPLAPGSVLGIIGGGQLARMIAIAAAQYGLKTHIFAPEENSPAFEVAAAFTCAPYDDEKALRDFAGRVDVITYEFENIPAPTADLLCRLRELHPSPTALATTQDRLDEKTFIAGLGIETAPFASVADEAELDAAITAIGLPAVLKTRRFGYDGKGQVIIRNDADLEKARALASTAPCILEGFVPFHEEVSVVATRAFSGEFAAFDLCANEHRNHILDVTRVPANVSDATGRQAIDIARRIAEALNYTGTLAVEMFLVVDGGAERVVVNEIAPRVHNSGHWTIEGAETSQFAQHVRAVCHWPLGSTARTGEIEMKNLIGSDVDKWQDMLCEPGASLHLYGKGDTRPGRKMGHVTRVSRKRSS